MRLWLAHSALCARPPPGSRAVTFVSHLFLLHVCAIAQTIPTLPRRDRNFQEVSSNLADYPFITCKNHSCSFNSSVDIKKLSNGTDPRSPYLEVRPFSSALWQTLPSLLSPPSCEPAAASFAGN